MKQIKFLSGDYFLTEDGTVFTQSSGKLRKFTIRTNTKGYKFVQLLDKNHKKHTYYIARLVARVFIGEPPTARAQVDHIDNDKINNHVSNLRYLTNRENQLYKFEHLRKSKVKAICQVCDSAYYRRNWNQKYCTFSCGDKAWYQAHKIEVARKSRLNKHNQSMY